MLDASHPTPAKVTKTKTASPSPEESTFTTTATLCWERSLSSLTSTSRKSCLCTLSWCHNLPIQSARLAQRFSYRALSCQVNLLSSQYIPMCCDAQALEQHLQGGSENRFMPHIGCNTTKYAQFAAKTLTRPCAAHNMRPYTSQIMAVPSISEQHFTSTLSRERV